MVGGEKLMFQKKNLFYKVYYKSFTQSINGFVDRKDSKWSFGLVMSFLAAGKSFIYLIIY